MSFAGNIDHEPLSNPPPCVVVDWKVFFQASGEDDSGVAQWSGSVSRLTGTCYIVRLFALLPDKSYALFSKSQPGGREHFETRISIAGGKEWGRSGIKTESGRRHQREDGVMMLSPLVGNKVCFVQVVTFTGIIREVDGKIYYRVFQGNRDSKVQQCWFRLPVSV